LRHRELSNTEAGRGDAVRQCGSPRPSREGHSRRTATHLECATFATRSRVARGVLGCRRLDDRSGRALPSCGVEQDRQSATSRLGLANREARNCRRGSTCCSRRSTCFVPNGRVTFPVTSSRAIPRPMSDAATEPQRAVASPDGVRCRIESPAGGAVRCRRPPSSGTSAPRRPSNELPAVGRDHVVGKELDDARYDDGRVSARAWRNVRFSPSGVNRRVEERGPIGRAARSWRRSEVLGAPPSVDRHRESRWRYLPSRGCGRSQPQSAAMVRWAATTGQSRAVARRMPAPRTGLRR
jgi:hypothetical protein